MKIKKILITILIFFFLTACQKEKATSVFEKQISDTDNTLQAAFFLNENIGYVCGGVQYTESTMLKTEDAGQTWEMQDVSEVEKMIFDVFFLNADTGFAVTHGMKILRTYDAGNSWQILQQYVAEKPWLPLRAIQFVDENVGFVAGGIGYSQGIIYKTTNGGDTWQYEWFEQELRDIFFINEHIGFACGYGAIYKTENAGETWILQDVKGDFFLSIHFPTAEIGYAVGNQGLIVKTEDAGETWQTIKRVKATSINRPILEDVFFVDENVGFVAGKNLFWQTQDGGCAWHQLEAIDFAKFYGMFIFENENGFVVGENGNIVRFEL